MKICRKCGAANKDANNFCSSCGNRLDEAPPSVPPVEEPVKPGFQPLPKLEDVQARRSAPENRGKYLLTLTRPAASLMKRDVFFITIDESILYHMNHNFTGGVFLPAGNHEMSVFFWGSGRVKRFTFRMDQDLTITLSSKDTSIFTIWAGAVKAEDSQGNVY